MSKKQIPQSLRNSVWNRDCGRNYGYGYCQCCQGLIYMQDFQCGHVKAESHGGDTNLQNLKAICGPCNRSMGAQDMRKFMKKYGYHTPSYFYHFLKISLFAILLLMIYSITIIYLAHSYNLSATISIYMSQLNIIYTYLGVLYDSGVELIKIIWQYGGYLYHQVAPIRTFIVENWPKLN